MMGCWNRDQQVCASCRYWAGCRELDFNGSHFFATEQMGTCQKPFGPFRGHEMGEGSYCPKWDSYDSTDY